MTENPWGNLYTGGSEAKRVDSKGKHDFFWVVSDRGEPGLVLRLDTETEAIRPLPKMKNLDLSYRDLEGRQGLVLLLKDPEQKELFASLCRDIVSAGELAAGNADALQRALRRALRWHHLLRGGRSDILSLEEQRGLVGELHFLEKLIDLTGLSSAIEAWRGPLGSAKDFELGECLVEVKARRGAARPYVQISSEDQLSDVESASLVLTVVPVDAVIKPHGMTLTDHVQALEDVFAQADLETYSRWEETLAATGFDFEDDYSERRWIAGEPNFYSVRDDFPRITTPLKPGVSGVRYSIALDACAPFEIAFEDVSSLITESLAA